MALRVVGQHVGRIEAHRLAVEEPAVELDREIALEPGGLVGEQREGNGVAVGEAELGEADQVVEDAFGHLDGDAALGGALHEGGAVALDQRGPRSCGSWRDGSGRPCRG